MSKPETRGKSSGYAVYSELFEDNIYIAPYFEVQVGRFLANYPETGKITAKDQWVCKEGSVNQFGPMFHLTALWFHALPHSEIEDAYHDGH